MKSFLLLISLFITTTGLQCQDKPTATWDDITWLAGNWIGDGFGGTSYETWSEPIEGIMLGTYRHVYNGKNNFFELFMISETEDGSFVLKLRHFNPDMNAWEDETSQLVWNLKSVTEDAVTFGPCTYQRIGDDKMKISLIMSNNGEKKTEVFNFERVK